MHAGGPLSYNDLTSEVDQLDQILFWGFITKGVTPYALTTFLFFIIKQGLIYFTFTLSTIWTITYNQNEN